MSTGGCNQRDPHDEHAPQPAPRLVQHRVGVPPAPLAQGPRVEVHRDTVALADGLPHATTWPIGDYCAPLRARLAAIKGRAGADHSLRIAADHDVPYDVLTELIHCVRGDHAELFTDVVFEVAP